MFWIVGGEEVAKALEKISHGPVVSAIAQQLQHVDWVGFRFYDGIFPLFLFLIGVSIVLSLDRLTATAGKRGALMRIARRSLLLFAIGVFYYGGLTQVWPNVQLSGVLHRIAICYFAAATLYVLLPRHGIYVATVVCLLGYWALLSFVPFPDVNIKHDSLGKKGSQTAALPLSELFPADATKVSGSYEEGRNLTNYVDALWLPGKKRNLYYSSEGLLSTIPAIATTLFGILAGWVLTHARLSEKRKVITLVAGGTVAMAVGYLWGWQCPIIKRIWTPSFCLVASGFSAILMGIFYLIVDVWRQQRWCTPLLWIGSNALVIYLVANLVDFQSIALRLVGGDIQRLMETSLGPGAGGLLVALTALALPILLVRFLYQQRVFVRL